jgi:hypothetical protein
MKYRQNVKKEKNQNKLGIRAFSKEKKKSEGKIMFRDSL